MAEYTLRKITSNPNKHGINFKVEAIKTLRTAFNQSLMVAKNTVEAADESTQIIIGDLSNEAFTLAQKNLAKVGYEFTDQTTGLGEFVNRREVLHQLIKDAIDSKRYDLSKDLIDIIEKYFGG